MPEDTCLAVGLMSGTSMDGIDAALIETDGEAVVWRGPALTHPYDADFRRDLRERFSGTLIYCGHYTAQRAQALIENGLGDAAAFGRPYIANPDLVERFRRDAALNEPNPETFYGGGAEGYTDYPALD